MVNPQEYLNEKYPLEEREKITKLEIIQKNLKGSLKIENFPNLTELNLTYNRITELEVNNCPKLTNIDCSHNLITKFKVAHPETLISLNLQDNNFPEQGLIFLKDFVNLTSLKLANYDKKRIEKGTYNRFNGSLKPLWNLEKLTSLDVSNTDVDSGWEYLPDSLERYFHCWVDERPEAKVNDIFTALKDYYANWGRNHHWTGHDMNKWRKDNYELFEAVQDEKEEAEGILPEPEKIETISNEEFQKLNQEKQLLQEKLKTTQEQFKHFLETYIVEKKGQIDNLLISEKNDKQGNNWLSKIKELIEQLSSNNSSSAVKSLEAEIGKEKSDKLRLLQEELKSLEEIQLGQQFETKVEVSPK